MKLVFKMLAALIVGAALVNVAAAADSKNAGNKKSPNDVVASITITNNTYNSYKIYVNKVADSGYYGTDYLDAMQTIGYTVSDPDFAVCVDIYNDNDPTYRYSIYKGCFTESADYEIDNISNNKVTLVKKK